jgi:hypothetical protein
VIAVGGSYVRPTVIVCIIGATIWVSYVVYVKRTNPWPDSPVFLPEDERDIAKTFAVGTLEDAAYVSGRTPQEFRRLSSSSNVLDQRALLDAAFTYGKSGHSFAWQQHEAKNAFHFPPSCLVSNCLFYSSTFYLCLLPYLSYRIVFF